MDKLTHCLSSTTTLNSTGKSGEPKSSLTNLIFRQGGRNTVEFRILDNLWLGLATL